MKISVSPEPTTSIEVNARTPRIFYLYRPQTSALGHLSCALDHCAAMGFNTVLMEPRFQPNDSDDVLPPTDQSSGSSSSCEEFTDDEFVAAMVSACSARGLALYFDLTIDRIAASDSEVVRHPEWFEISHGDDDGAVDPRVILTTQEFANFLLESPAVAKIAKDWWVNRISAWLDAGVCGFRCMRVQHAPAPMWGELISSVREHSPACKFLAWTVGLPLDETAQLRDCGFDAVFSSSRWWDLHSDWLGDEFERLRRIAPSIAFPEAPFEWHSSNELSTADHIAASRRALWLAAFCGDGGLLVPAGFEYGEEFDAGHSHGKSRAHAPFDLSEEIAKANAWIAGNDDPHGDIRSYNLSRCTRGAAALLRVRSGMSKTQKDASLLLLNAFLDREIEIDPSELLTNIRLFTDLEPALPSTGRFTLSPGEARLFTARQPRPILVTGRGKRSVDAAIRAPRIAIENVTPSVDQGRFPAKRIVGERVVVEADIFSDGHEELGVHLLWRTADARDWNETRMFLVNNDRWRAELPLVRLGTYQFTIEAWRDDFSTLRSSLKKKRFAHVSMTHDIDDVVEAIRKVLRQDENESHDVLRNTLEAFDAAQSDEDRALPLLSDELGEAMATAAPRRFLYRHPTTFHIWAERPEARFASWYELFPRSAGGTSTRHGTFYDVIVRLDAIRDMGFDVLYMPPIHPIGRINRKGRNNSLKAEPGDPGSPYAIGAKEGGHTSIHPELGTLEDFRRLRDAASSKGLELALDFAIQCSPDHPWLKDHPEWFKWQSDGSLRYAENPPKTYEDIANVGFYGEGAVPDLWIALEEVVLFWVTEGVKIFRVDNPHTKPFPFWEWMIASIRNRHPDVIFLAEAFTTPKRMYRLAKLGFSQSYTYFTWRHTKAELTEYLSHLANDNVRDFFRPHFFVNTPDINPHFLQTSGRPGHLIRAALATLTSGLWGMYSGFEICEATPLPGREEYQDSEKYEIRDWDWDRPGNIIHEITMLNRIRKNNPALHSQERITFYNAFNDNILYFAKATQNRENVVLVAINLDPFHAQEAAIELPLWEWGLSDDDALSAEDLMQGTSFEWRGKNQSIRLDPTISPFAIWRIGPSGGIMP